MGRDDCKLTVIHGQSGVGKSSMLQAGFIPALTPQAINARNGVVVLQQVYTNWTKRLGQRLLEAMTGTSNGLALPEAVHSTTAILEQLRQNVDHNLLTILVFDQFEEFFFIYKDPVQRKPFYDFLRECINTPYVKVILSLREDYLHYLLECNRLESLEIIDNNILDKNILFYLGNFTSEDAKSVVQSLTRQTQFSPDEALVDELVNDLAKELGEVRPIELQVVGSQLQTENITTLVHYQEKGPKEALVGRFLEEVVKDCGPENEHIAKLVLYLLTDENNTRPLKTRSDLELELDVAARKLDLVLAILVKSRLIFQIPASPADRYQLVHDYLVAFVRQQQSARLIAEIEKEREQRKLTEAKLNQVLKKQLRTARRSAIAFGLLASLIAGFALLATTAALNGYATLLSYQALQKEGLDELVQHIKAGKWLKRAIWKISDAEILTLFFLQSTTHFTNELNLLEGHKDRINDIKFSPDDRYLASASEDGTVKIWKMNGEEYATFRGHKTSVTNLAFSPREPILASASEDQTIKLLELNGGEIKSLTGHQDSVISISFSSDGRILGSASKDGTVRLWDLDTGKVTVLNHDGVNSVEFDDVNQSNDSLTITTTSETGTVKSWTLDGNLLEAFDDFAPICSDSSNEHSNSITIFSSDGELVASTTGSNGNKILISQNNQGSKELLSSENAGDRLTEIHVSSDSQIIASIDQSNRMSTWREDGSLLHRNFGHGIVDISFSLDSRIIGSVNRENVVKLHSLDNGKNRLLDDYGNNIKTLNFSLPDSQLIATASRDNTVKLWQRDGVLVKTLEGHNDWVTNVTFSPDGQLIVTTSQDNTVKLWRRDGILIKTLDEYNDWEVAATFSPDGQLITTASLDNTVKLWRRNGTLINTLEGHNGWLTDINFSPDGQLIATASLDNTVKLWQRDGTLIKTLDGCNTHVSFSPDGKIIASFSSNDIIKLWRRDGTLFKILEGHAKNITHISFSSDSKLIASASTDNTVKIWELDGNLSKTLKGHTGIVNHVIFSPDNQLIASASSDKTIKIWNLNGILLETLEGHKNDVASVNFISDGELLTSIDFSSSNSAQWEFTVKLWQRDGTLIDTLKGISDLQDYSPNFYPTYSRVENNLHLSSDGKTIAFITVNDKIKSWEKNGFILNTIGETDDWINSISFSPNGQFIASASDDKTVKLWKLDGTLVETFEGHKDRVNSVSFSSDNKLIAAASDDKTAKIWKLDGTLVATFQGHEDRVNSVSFSPDNKLIATASDDKTVKLWKLDGTPIKTLKRDEKVNSVGFSPDGKFLLGSFEGGVMLWFFKSMFAKYSPIAFLGDASIHFGSNSNNIFIFEDNTLFEWNLNLDELLDKSCDQVRDYLKTNPNVAEGDRRLCDGLGSEEPALEIQPIGKTFQKVSQFPQFQIQ